MKIQSPFTFISSLVKQITCSWTTNKTCDMVFEKKTISFEVVHEPLPVATPKDNPGKTLHIPMETLHTNDYSSTY